MTSNLLIIFSPLKLIKVQKQNHQNQKQDFYISMLVFSYKHEHSTYSLKFFILLILSTFLLYFHSLSSLSNFSPHFPLLYHLLLSTFLTLPFFSIFSFISSFYFPSPLSMSIFLMYFINLLILMFYNLIKVFLINEHTNLNYKILYSIIILFFLQEKKFIQQNNKIQMNITNLAKASGSTLITLLQYSILLSLKRVNKHLTFFTKLTISLGTHIFPLMELTTN